MSAIQDYGIKEEKINARKETEAGHLKVVKPALDEEISNIKGAGDFVLSSFNSLKDKYDFAKANDREAFLYGLKADPNLICRPAQKIKNHADQIAMTVPLEYKWVPEEEKKSLGFRSVSYRYITEDRIVLLEEKFKEKVENERLRNNYVDILCVMDHLYRLEADHGWILLEVLKISGLTGLPIRKLLSTLSELQEVKLVIVHGQTFYNGKYRPTICICETKEVYDLRHDEDERNTINIHFAIKKRGLNARISTSLKLRKFQTIITIIILIYFRSPMKK